MKQFAVWLFVFGSILAVPAQTNTVTIDDLMQSAQAWAEENLDEEALSALQSGDEKKVKEFFGRVQKTFQGEYVIDLAQLKQAADVIIPILEASEDTIPYANWLKAHLDYLETAEELRLIITPPKPEPGKPASTPRPAPQQTREIWIKKISSRPVPPEAKPYIGKLKPIFAAEKVPAELIWIAEVESSFNPNAKSPMGAAGLFQLMPSTAKQYGLRTWPFDQRQEPELSARATAKYLAKLYARLKDWRLVLAAYNAGEGTVTSVMKRREANSYDGIARHLPAETQMFVPKVEAVLLRREGIKITDL